MERQERFVTNSEDALNMTEQSMEDKELDMREILPCIPLRGLSVFPNTVVHFDIGGKTDDGEGVRQVADADDVAPADASRRKEV